VSLKLAIAHQSTTVELKKDLDVATNSAGAWQRVILTAMVEMI
jgi:hypothetical protein